MRKYKVLAGALSFALITGFGIATNAAEDTTDAPFEGDRLVRFMEDFHPNWSGEINNGFHFMNGALLEQMGVDSDNIRRNLMNTVDDINPPRDFTDSDRRFNFGANDVDFEEMIDYMEEVHPDWSESHQNMPNENHMYNNPSFTRMGSFMWGAFNNRGAENDASPGTSANEQQRSEARTNATRQAVNTDNAAEVSSQTKNNNVNKPQEARGPRTNGDFNRGQGMQRSGGMHGGGGGGGGGGMR